MPILDHFPSELTPRDIQKEILEQIVESINSGFKKIVISAPTGVGKSALGVCLGNYLENAFFITKTKSLQDQYTRDFPFLLPVKGKSNFECLKLMDLKNIDDPILAKSMGYTCDKGECAEGKTESGQTIFCKYKPDLKAMASFETQDDKTCLYYNTKYNALLSNFSVWNYSAFFQLMKYNKSHFGEYMDKKISIFDEAHGIESQILQFIGLDISKKQFEECKIDIKRYDVSKVDEVIQLLTDMRIFYGSEMGKMDNNEISYNYKNYSRYENNFKKFADVIASIEEDPDNFIISKISNDILDSRGVSMKPLDISGYIEDFFETEYQAFMSATIDKKSFSETMGIPESEIAFIDTPKSPFPLEHRKIDFLDVARLGSKADPKKEFEAIQKIDELLTNHKNERGLILTQSIHRCLAILKNLSPQNQKRIRICHSTNSDSKTQDEIIAEHRKDETGVLLSSSLWEGVDLKDDDSRFQIIAKIPYQNLGDLRVKKKMKKYPLWLNSIALMTVLQGFGRSIRSEDDWAKTYVLDSGIHDLISRTRSIIPRAYHDVLNIS